MWGTAGASWADAVGRAHEDIKKQMRPLKLIQLGATSDSKMRAVLSFYGTS